MNAAEFHAQKAIVAYLDAAYPDIVYHSVPNGAVLAWDEAERPRARREMAKLKVTGLKPGAPDLIIIGPGGRYIGLEVKSDIGKLNPDQAAFGKLLRSAGALYGVVRNVEDVRSALAQAGVRGRERAA